MPSPVTGTEELADQQRARRLIDGHLTAAGWQVQHRKDLNLFVGPGVREVGPSRRRRRPACTTRPPAPTAPTARWLGGRHQDRDVRDKAAPTSHAPLSKVPPPLVR